jgi:hypothetical protein
MVDLPVLAVDVRVGSAALHATPSLVICVVRFLVATFIVALAAFDYVAGSQSWVIMLIFCILALLVAPSCSAFRRGSNESIVQDLV